MAEKPDGYDAQPRGDAWVVGQVVLIALIALAAFFGPEWPWHRGTSVGGLILLALGLVLIASGIGALGGALTPFPRPRGPLVDRGAYALVRHPMYGGVLLGILGVSLLTGPLTLIPVVAGVIFLTLKARHEERLLREAVPEYAEYCRRVRARFVPFLF